MGSKNEIVGPRKYPSFERLADCEIFVHDKQGSGEVTAITFDDLFEAFKDKLEDTFERKREDHY